MTSVLQLSRELYPIESIKEAITAFQDLCKIRISTHDKKYYTCSFSSCLFDTTITMREFENYLIDLVNTKDT